MQPPWRAGLHAQLDLSALLWLVPALQTRPPAANVPRIRLVLSSKFLAERRFFIQDYEQMLAKSDCCDGVNCQHVRVSEDYSQPDPKIHLRSAISTIAVYVRFNQCSVMRINIS